MNVDSTLAATTLLALVGALLIRDFPIQVLLLGVGIVTGAVFIVRLRAAAREVRLRPASEDDLHALAVLYAYAIHTLGPEFYSPEQVEAWAHFADEKEEFRSFVLDSHTLVAEQGGKVIGFGGVDETGRIASLYVGPHVGRQGVGGTLLDALIAWAEGRGITELHTEASELSRGLFAGYGFSVEEVESVVRGGVSLERYRMVRGAVA